jgi:hypothetical protein
MSLPAGNPYEPPSPAVDLPVDLVAGRLSPVTEVTFRYSPEDLRRVAIRGGRSWLLLTILVFAAASAIGPFLFDQIRREGLSPRVLNLSSVAALVLVVFLGLCYVLTSRLRGRGAPEAPFETTLSLSAEGLRVREAGIADLLRTWTSIAGISHDRVLIRFDFLVFDASTGGFLPRPGAIAPVRAFASEEDAASFVAAARRFQAAAGPTIRSG